MYGDTGKAQIAIAVGVLGRLMISIEAEEEGGGMMDGTGDVAYNNPPYVVKRPEKWMEDEKDEMAEKKDEEDMDGTAETEDDKDEDEKGEMDEKDEMDEMDGKDETTA